MSESGEALRLTQAPPEAVNPPSATVELLQLLRVLGRMRSGAIGRLLDHSNLGTSGRIYAK